MNIDKSTIIGFSLLALLFCGYFYSISSQQKEYEASRKRIEDSIALIEKNKIVLDKRGATSENENKISISNLSSKTKKEKSFLEEKLYTIENDVIKVVLSNKGAVPVSLILKKHKSHNEKNVTLISDKSFDFNYEIKQNESINDINEVYFQNVYVKNLNDSSKVVEFEFTNANGNYLKHIYVVKPNLYLFDFKIETNKVSDFFNSNEIRIKWKTYLIPHEKNIEYEKTQSQLTIMTTKDEFDYFSLTSEIDEKIEKPLKWLSVKQQFFNNTIISENPMIDVKSVIKENKNDSNKYFMYSQTDFKVGLTENQSFLKFNFFYGPTDYYILKNHKLEKIINIGQGFYSFVKYVNKFLVMPVFKLLQSFIKNYGLVILFLTIFLRVITAPLLYTSYTSSAKMKVIKPELDKLKLKFKDDQQGYAVKQMELFKTAGVNPLGGCIPALLQIPIFLSLFYFFNSCIELRGESFLWAKDLSTYDSICDFGFEIPFYGSHVSLFTILNVITSFLISYTSMKNTADHGNAMLKYMPYIFPIILLGFFNKLPSALTWYYTVSNIITLLLQYVIQNFIINHNKIIEQIEEKRKNPAKKSSWIQKIEQVQNTQKKLQELKNKNIKN